MLIYWRVICPSLPDFTQPIRGPWPLVLRLFATALLCFSKACQEITEHGFEGVPPMDNPRGLFEKYTTYPMLYHINFLG